MLNIPEEIKDLFRKDNRYSDTSRKMRLRFFDKEIKLLYPGEDIWPSADLFPAELAPVLTIDVDQGTLESMELTQVLCENETLTFGECNGAMLEVIVADLLMDVTGMEFVLSLEIGGYEMMLGIFKANSIVRQTDRTLKKITAYNRMINFQTDVAAWYQGLAFPMTLKAFRDSLCAHIGLVQKVVELPMDNMQIDKTVDPEQLYGLDVIKAICEINGCFGQIDVTGKFRYVYLGQAGLFPSENLFPSEDLFPRELEGETLSSYHPSDSTYENYVAYGIDKVRIRQEEGDVGGAHGIGTNTYTIQGNFLVFGKSTEELDQIAQAVYEKISGRLYRPCKLVTSGLPWIETGDGIICYTSDDVIETYCLKRTLKGIQAMTDTYEAFGSQERKEDFSVKTQILQLQGKTAVIKKSVEEVSVKVTDLKEYAEAQFKVQAELIIAEVTRAKKEEEALSASIKIQAEQIELKVSKGEVSSQISIESGGVDIRGNRFSWTSSYSSMSSDGKLKCREIEAINGRFTGELESDVFYAGDGMGMLGDYYVSADGSNILRSLDETIIIQTGRGGPFGGYPLLKLSDSSGTTELTDHGMTINLITARDIQFTDSWTEGDSALTMFKDLYSRTNNLRSRIEALEG